jgi:hypothetical protein
MSSSILVPFNDKNSFSLKEQIKEICNGKSRFDGEKKVWMVPQGALPELKRLSEELDNKNKDNTKEIWKNSCIKCGYKFVRKGTPQYEEVLTLFKKLIKEPKEEEDEEEKYDEDDVVYD